jgi:hypothetical protein
MVRLKILDSNGGFLGRDVADVNTIDTNNIFEHAGALVGRFPVKKHSISSDAGQGDDGRDRDFEPQKRNKLFDRLG